MVWNRTRIYLVAERYIMVVGRPQGGFPRPQPILLWVGVDKAFERDIIDAHCKACLYVGINIGGINHEVMPDQWEFHLRSSVGEEI
ncbi:hypothetical protein Lser_V15G42973 [Lactuca serriola]